MPGVQPGDHPPLAGAGVGSTLALSPLLRASANTFLLCSTNAEPARTSNAHSGQSKMLLELISRLGIGSLSRYLGHFVAPYIVVHRRSSPS
jgi:hypothetical protein